MLVEFYRFWILNPRTGKPDLTAGYMSRAEAAEAHPGAEPEMRTYELREVPDTPSHQDKARADDDWKWYGQSVATYDIARHLGLSRSYVASRITKAPDFPAPFVNLGQRTKRWLRADVDAWIATGAKRRR